MADDLGAKELACYGNNEHRTPNLDKLGETGVRFETCYAAPLCHPTRLMIMTGQYGCHNGVLNFAGRRAGPARNSPIEDVAKSHVTFANLLKKAGYATALSGKWQLSGKQPDMIRECDFDEYCAWAYKPDLPAGVEHTGAWENENKTARYWHPSIVKNGEYIPTTKDDYGPDIHMDFAIDFARRNKDKPFFIYHTMCLTHNPHMPTPDTLGPGVDRFSEGKQNFKAVVEYVDKLVGRLVSALDEMGLRENTLVFFTTDNGTGGEGKNEPTELGARVPMIVNCPGIVKARGATMELTDLSDILPTLCEFAGAPVPNDRPIDGMSYARFLRGDTDTHREWIHSFLADTRILRTKRWLLEDNTPHHYGRLYDCGSSRNGDGYKEVTNSTEPEVAAAKSQFAALLKKLPAPDLAPV
jgi:arylsulfatase A